MTLTVFLAEAGLLDLSLSFLVEIVAFLAMIAILARWVYPRVIAAAEGRQRQIAEQLEAAEKARQDAEQRLKDAEAELQKARGQSSEIIEGANKLAEQMRADGRARAEEEAKRIIESARREIEAERQKALDSVRAEVADLVVAATERVIGESLDITRQRELIERAISEVTSDGRGRG
jgi:F-type H+-transporting ATPase subunit b